MVWATRKDTIYDHTIAIDGSITNMAVARMTKKSNKITAIDVPSDIEDLQAYLKNLIGIGGVNKKDNLIDFF
jgi:hypothetical protein